MIVSYFILYKSFLNVEFNSINLTPIGLLFNINKLNNLNFKFFL